MGLLSNSYINQAGKCNGCVLTVQKDDLLQCEECKISFHVMCTFLDTGEKHCTKSLLTQFLTKSTRKPNFSWKCDPCTTCQDVAKKTDLAQIVHGLVLKVETLTTALENFKQETKQDNTTLANTLDSLKQDIKQDITSIQPHRGTHGQTQGPYKNSDRHY